MAAPNPAYMRLTCQGRKPAKCRLPGLDTRAMLHGRLGPGRDLWRFCCHGLFAN